MADERVLLPVSCSPWRAANPARRRTPRRRYLDAFEEHGYDDWDEIQSMGEARLQRLVERVGLSSNHADRFLAHVAQDVA